MSDFFFDSTKAAALPCEPQQVLQWLIKNNAEAKRWSKITQMCRCSDWVGWIAFAKAREVPALPITQGDLDEFLFLQSKNGRKPSSMTRCVHTLRTVHRLFKIPWSLKVSADAVDRRRLEKSPVAGGWKSKDPIRMEQLRRIVEALNLKEPEHAQCAALLWIAFEALLRPCELVALRVEDLERLPDGEALLNIRKVNARCLALGRP